MLRLLAALILFAMACAAPAQTSVQNPVQTYAIGPGQSAPIAPDGRVLGHIPYDEVNRSTLVSAPPGFAVGQPCMVNPDMARDLARLILAQKVSGIAGTLRGVSCYRSVAHQRAVFCGPGKRCRNAIVRARVVGPPAHSEHATGYALDFGVRPSGHCGDVDDCIAATPAGRWLIANAPSYGFELSFPAGNAQGVTWEPWHWRWVGVNGDVPAAAKARALFARARAQFPANPVVMPLIVRVIAQPPMPVVTAPPPAPSKADRKPRSR